MRIAFDMDGVLADLHGAFAATAQRLFPELDTVLLGAPEIGSSPPLPEAVEPSIVAKPRVHGDLPLTTRQTDAVWKALSDVPDFWETLGEIEAGTIRRLGTLADERRWEMLFITSRPRSAGRTVQRQSQRWLEKMGFPLPSVYVVQGSRGFIAKALQIDVVVDDRPENCLDVVLESQSGAILVWRGQREAVPGSAKRMGIAVVTSVADCLEAIIKIEQPDERGVLERLRSLFGLRTSRRPAGQ